MEVPTPIYPGDEIGIDFEVVAEKKDVDLLREAVLELIVSLGKTDTPNITVYFGPACDKLLEMKFLEMREEAKG